MTHEEFIKWLDDKIVSYNKQYQDSPKWDKNEYAAGYSDALCDAKEKFLSVTPPPTTIKP